MALCPISLISWELFIYLKPYSEEDLLEVVLDAGAEDFS
jgi:hypothetical protein